MDHSSDDPHHLHFPPRFFERADERDDAAFYAFDRFVTHLDERALEAVGALYDELGLSGQGSGDVLDLCSSWISHFPAKPDRLVVTGMNAHELAANGQADAWLVHDLNVEPRLPFDDASFDAVTCCVSVDYLTRPLDVFGDVARMLRPGGLFVCTFSNRCFPSKAIRGWLATDDRTHVEIVRRYFELTPGFGDATAELRTSPDERSSGDPLFAVWARLAPSPDDEPPGC